MFTSASNFTDNVDAVFLYIAGLSLIEFQQELARRQIPIFADLDSVEQEIADLKDLGDL